jgi:hypothetical protein
MSTLSLEPCDIAIERPQWIQADSSPATLGLGSDGKLQLLMEHNGPMLFDWSLAAEEGMSDRSDRRDWAKNDNWGIRKDAASPAQTPNPCPLIPNPSVATFAVELPRCAVNHFQIELPEALVARCEPGMLQHCEAGAKGLRRWQFELGGHTSFRLVIAPAHEEDHRATMTVARQTSNYGLSLHGLETDMQFVLGSRQKAEVRQSGQRGSWGTGVPQTPQALPTEIVVALESPLVPVTATLGGEPVTWRVLSTPNVSPVRLAIEVGSRRQAVGREAALPSALCPLPTVLRLKAIAPLVSGKPWKLPRVTVENVLWQEGRSTLLVANPLYVDRLSLVDCRLVGLSPSPRAEISGKDEERGAATGLRDRHVTPKAAEDSGLRTQDSSPPGEQLDFEAYSADAAITVTVNEQPSVIEAVEGVSTSLDGNKFSSRIVSDFQSLAPTSTPGQFMLHANVLPQWTIDSIQTVPADALDDWSVEPRGRSRGLTIRLARPLTPDRPLRVTVIARRPNSGGARMLSADDVVPLRYLGVGNAASRPGRPAAPGGGPGMDRRLVTLHSSAANQFQIETNDDTLRINPLDLAPNERDLFADPPVEPMFLDDTSAAAVRIAVAGRRSKYDANVRTLATIRDLSLQEAYDIRCAPAAATQLERILVRFNQHRTGPFRWTVDGLAQDDFIARPLQETGEGDEWELTLKRPQTSTIEIHAARETTIKGPAAISLASLPDAVAQQGELTLRSTGSRPLMIRNIRLAAIKSAGVAASQYQAVRATYSYDPRVEQAPGIEPALFVDVGQQPSSTIWCVDCHVNSRFATDGAVEHVITWRLERTVGGTVLVALPEGWSQDNVRSIWVDQNRLMPGDVPFTRDGRIAIDLPPGEKLSTVDLCLSGSGEPLTAMGQLHAALPDLQRGLGDKAGFGGLLSPRTLSAPSPALPVFAYRWTVWLPAGYQVCGDDPARGPMSLGQRVCGWFGRDEHEQVFNPLSGKQWKSLFFGPDEADSRVPPLAAEGVGSGQRAVDREAELPTALCLLTTNSGWSERSIDLQGTIGSASYVYRPTITAAAWLAFLLSFGAGVWKLVRRAQILVLLAAAAAVAALMLPTPCASIASSLLLGFLSTLMYSIVAPWLAVRRTETALGRRTDSASTVTAALPFGAPLLAFLLLQPICALSGTVHAAEPAGEIEAVRGRGSEAQPNLTSSPPHGLATSPTDSEPVRKYNVLIPIDSKQKPLGSSYFVPEELYKSLYQNARQSADLPQGAMIVGATYQATLTQRGSWGTGVPQNPLPAAKTESALGDRSSTNPAAPNPAVKAEFSLRAFHAPSRIRIPLRRDEIKLVPGETELDGRPIQPEWQADGAALLIDIDEVGEHRLEISLWPTVRACGGSSGFRISVPRVATARAEVLVSAEGPALEFPGAHGTVQWESELSRWSIQLGPVADFAVRWPDAPPSAAGQVDAEELLWLRVLPGSVQVDAKLNLKVVSGRLQDMQIRVDPDLELVGIREEAKNDSGGIRELGISGDAATPRLAGSNPQSPIPNPSSLPTANCLPPTNPGGLQTILFHWPQPIADASSLDLHFLWKGASCLGNVRPPQFELQRLAFGQTSIRTTRQWLAMSVDPALEHSAPAGAGLVPVAVPEFAAAWKGIGDWAKNDNWGIRNDAAAPRLSDSNTYPLIANPSYAFQLSGPAEDVTLSTRPRPAETTVDQSLFLTCGERQITVQFNAQLATQSGRTLQYSLQAPVGLLVRTVSLISDGAERVARWSQNDDGEITIFTTTPVSGPQQFQISGALPVQSKTPLPRFRFSGATTTASVVCVLRRPEAIVDIEGMRDLAKNDSGGIRGLEIKDWGLGISGDAAARRLAGSNPQSPIPNPSLVLAFRDDRIPTDRLKNWTLALRVRPNRPQIEGIVTTRLVVESNRCQATVDCRLKAHGGAIDAVTVELPKTLPGPFELVGSRQKAVGSEAAASGPESNLPTAYRPLPTSTGLLVVTPSGAATDMFNFTLTSPLEPGLGGEIAAPDVAFDKTFKLRRLIVLPTMAGGQPVTWNLRGLRKTNEPPLAASPNSHDVVYEVVSASWQAVRVPAAQSSAPPHVAQQFVRLAWHGDGSCVMAARWQLAGAHRGEHTLVLPDGFKLMRLSVDDLPVDPQPAAASGGLENGAWLVPIGIDRSNVVIDALCFAPALFPPLASGWPRYVQFRQPKLGELAVDETTWIVAGPAAMAGRVEEGAARIETIENASAKEFLAATAADFPSGVSEGSGPDAIYAYQGTLGPRNAETLTLRYSPAAGLSWPEIALAAAVTLAVALLAMQLLTRSLLWRILVRRPYAIGIVIGVVWWLCLSPSALGLLLVIVSLVARVVPSNSKFREV